MGLNSRRALAAIGLVCGLVPRADATTIEHISNGGFETGTFAGWTVQNAGSGNWAINDGTFDPNGPAVPLAPISGSYDAVSFQGGPGTHILSETFVLPVGVLSATLSWDDRIQNYANVFSDPNQEWRVVFENVTTNVFTEIFSTNPGDPLLQLGPNSRSFDITGLVQASGGDSVRVRFEEQDNLFFFNASLDNVSLVTTIPEPNSALLAMLALLGVRMRVVRRLA